MDNVSLNIQPHKGFKRLFRSIFRHNEYETNIRERNESIDYLKSMKQAVQELENIRMIFDTTSDPELIEYAIYEEFALKMKFSYLLRKIKEKNIKSDSYFAVYEDERTEINL